MWKNIVMGLVGAGLFLLVLLHINIPQTWAILKGANLLDCLLALAALVFMIYVKGFRFSYLLRMQGHPYSVWNGFLVYMVSMFWGNVTPGRAGDFVKVLYLKEDLSLPIGWGMSSVLVDRVLDLYLLLVLGGLGVLLYPMPIDPISVKMVLAVKVLFVVLLLFTLLAFNKKIGGWLMKTAFQKFLKPEYRGKTDEIFNDFHQGMEAFYKPSFLVPVLFSVGAYGIAFGACDLMVLSLGLKVNFFYLAFVISVVNISSLMTLFGLGTRDMALIILFGLIGIAKEPSEAYSVLLFFVGSILFTAVCFSFSLVKPIRFKNS